MKKAVLCCVWVLCCVVAVAQKRVKVVCVENSITYGHLLPNRETQSYPVQLQKMLGVGYEVGNFGKSGSILLSQGYHPYREQEEYRAAIYSTAEGSGLLGKTVYSSITGDLGGLPTSTFKAEAAPSFGEDIRVQQMSGFLSDVPGIEQGVSACYAGWLDGKLLMAGGCNFPETPAAEGGKKRYYRNIYLADVNDTLLMWRKVGRLPAAAAYGVSVTASDGVICIGGNNADGSLTAVYKIVWNNHKLQTDLETLPPLPYALDNLCGTCIGNCLFVVGGYREGGKPSRSFLCLDLGRLEEGWQLLPNFPGNPRVQAVCAGFQRKNGEMLLYMWGGFAPAVEDCPATLSVDGYRYSSRSRQWTPVATPVGSDGEAVSLGGGTAVSLNDSLVMCIGGVNKDVFLSALRQPEKDYLLHPAAWYKFNDRILIYNTRQDAWQEVARTSALARAGAALVGWDGVFFHINGEIKPGIRSSVITRIQVE